MKLAGRCEYLYIVVDDRTHVVYTWLMRLKLEAPEAFSAFKAAVEIESGAKICKVMTDNVHKLSMGVMQEICEKEGIQLNTTVPYHPASNGIVEWAIGVLTSAVRAMLHNSSLPQYLWAEVYNTATYVHNRTPTRALGGVTPYEAHYRVKPKVEHLRAFGAPCASVEPQHNLKKLDDRASMCFFMGYKYGGGGYWVWDPKRQVIIKLRDIVFFETGLPSPTLRALNKLADDADIHEQQPLEPTTEPAASAPA